MELDENYDDDQELIEETNESDDAAMIQDPTAWSGDAEDDEAIVPTPREITKEEAQEAEVMVSRHLRDGAGAPRFSSLFRDSERSSVSARERSAEDGDAPRQQQQHRQFLAMGTPVESIAEAQFLRTDTFKRGQQQARIPSDPYTKAEALLLGLDSSEEDEGSDALEDDLPPAADMSSDEVAPEGPDPKPSAPLRSALSALEPLAFAPFDCGATTTSSRPPMIPAAPASSQLHPIVLERWEEKIAWDETLEEEAAAAAAAAEVAAANKEEEDDADEEKDVVMSEQGSQLDAERAGTSALTLSLQAAGGPTSIGHIECAPSAAPTTALVVRLPAGATDGAPPTGDGSAPPAAGERSGEQGQVAAGEVAAGVARAGHGGAPRGVSEVRGGHVGEGGSCPTADGRRDGQRSEAATRGGTARGGTARGSTARGSTPRDRARVRTGPPRGVRNERLASAAWLGEIVWDDEDPPWAGEPPARTHCSLA